MIDSSPLTHREIIDLWPTLSDFAADIGVPYGTAKQMRRRNSIPDGYRPAVVEGAKRRNILGIKYEVLTRTAPARKAVAAGSHSSSRGAL